MKKLLNKLSSFIGTLLAAVIFIGLSYWGFTEFLPETWNKDFGALHFIAKPLALLIFGTMTTLMGLAGAVSIYAAFGYLFSKEN
jgi:hypothetical protein|tara:strand:- start:200 stop:451 length:252 start_codon:yes stop_codon:yes gene_type:complete